MCLCKSVLEIFLFFCVDSGWRKTPAARSIRRKAVRCLSDERSAALHDALALERNKPCSFFFLCTFTTRANAHLYKRSRMLCTFFSRSARTSARRSPAARNSALHLDRSLSPTVAHVHIFTCTVPPTHCQHSLLLHWHYRPSNFHAQSLSRSKGARLQWPPYIHSFFF